MRSNRNRTYAEIKKESKESGVQRAWRREVKALRSNTKFGKQGWWSETYGY